MVLLVLAAIVLIVFLVAGRKGPETADRVQPPVFGPPSPPPPPSPQDQIAKSASQLMEETSEFVFVTGPAGTGKSTLLQKFRSETRKRVAVVAPTGVAAMNVGGETIHRFFHFPPKPVTSSDVKDLQDKGLVRAVDTLIIDEVSMVRADLLDAVDLFFRKNGRQSDVPFGGCQVVFVGDVYQLPPVVVTKAEKEFLTSEYDSEWFFDAHVFAQCSMDVAILEIGYRQPDPQLFAFLQRVRVGTAGLTELDFVNARVGTGPADSVYLTCTNDRAKNVNKAHYDALPGKEEVFTAVVEGDCSTTKSDFPADLELRLKPNSRVMFLRNDPNGRWVNGTLGTIDALSSNSIRARVNGSIFDVERCTWESLKHVWDPAQKQLSTTVIGRMTQFPVRLAWAITIHKSQGLTLAGC